MAIDQRLSREQCEKAFAAYVLKQQAAEVSRFTVSGGYDGGPFIPDGDYVDTGETFNDKPIFRIGATSRYCLYINAWAFSNLPNDSGDYFSALSGDVDHPRDADWSEYESEIVFTSTDVQPALVDLGVFIRKGKFNDQGQYELENPEEIPLPAICIAVPRAKEHDAGYPVCELHVIVMNATDEKTGTTMASRRFGWVAGLFNEDKLSAIQLAVNKPEGTDERVVQNFTVFGMYMTEDLGQEVERHWIDHLVYEVHCFPSDEFDEEATEILSGASSGVIIICDDDSFKSKDIDESVHDATLIVRNRPNLIHILLEVGTFAAVQISNCPVLTEFTGNGRLTTQDVVDQVLIDLAANVVAFGISDGTCYITGNGPPTQAGLDAQAILESWNWTVYVDT